MTVKNSISPSPRDTNSTPSQGRRVSVLRASFENGSASNASKPSKQPVDIPEGTVSGGVDKFDKKQKPENISKFIDQLQKAFEDVLTKYPSSSNEQVLKFTIEHSSFDQDNLQQKEVEVADIGIDIIRKMFPEQYNAKYINDNLFNGILTPKKLNAMVDNARSERLKALKEALDKIT